MEVRHSQDSLDGMGSSVDVYVDAVCALLDDSRESDLGMSVSYSGGYDVSFETIVRGGSNFLQRAKVGFDVEVSNHWQAYSSTQTAGI